MDEWLAGLPIEGAFLTVLTERFGVFDPQKPRTSELHRLSLGINTGKDSIPVFAPPLYYVIFRFFL